MTPHPPSDHPGPDALADLAEELLPPDRAAALHAHLAACPACAEDFALLRELPDLLADTPVPAMPQDLADRLAAALAAESAARAEARPQTPAATPAEPPRPTPPSTPSAPARTGSPAGAPPATTGPGRPPRRRRRGARLLLATAAVALVALGAGLGGALLDRGSSRDSGAASAHAPVTAADGSQADKTTGGDPTAPRQVAPGNGAEATGPDFTPDRLPAQVRQLLDGKAPHQLGAPTPEAASVPASCVLEAAGHPGEQPAAVGPGRYQGRPVLALVFRPPGGSGPLDVYLATPDCPGSTILLHSTVPAP
ncbi:hypothetical protein Kpho02_09660 [Kitasatospora phosalacinea]|uniref:Zinc-finger domain-containing protein n=1 Tax=Kitasatospora phosalacinea TaxID=2065 RepID=A0A9W6Q5R0_9ACTN|nr:hypothetical protein [Kitasatospora phosalacinea]GLW68667.1 hypothetical protein Kpho02_09660 [Kitasatospora phosalacinea]